MTTAEAQSLQDDAWTRGVWVVWVVTSADLEYPGRFAARAHTADHHGGVYLPGALVADTLDELRGQLPDGLTCRGRTSGEPPGVLETWD